MIPPMGQAYASAEMAEVIPDNSAAVTEFLSPYDYQIFDGETTSSERRALPNAPWSTIAVPNGPWPVASGRFMEAR